MSHMCVDFTLLSLGKLIVNCCNEGRKLLTGVPSMINMEVAPVSAFAWFVSIPIVLRYCWLGEPNICRTVVAKDGRGKAGHVIPGLLLVEFEQLDVITKKMSLLSTSLSFVTWVGSKGIASHIFLHLVANGSSAPHRQNPGNRFLCFPLVHASHPAAMYPCTFLWVNTS